jgi:hypothetical protein
MTLELVMNADGQLDHGAGSIVSGGTFTKVSIPSNKVEAEGRGVHKGQLNFTLTGASATGYDAGTVATVAPWQTINPTATKCKVNGELIMREGDGNLVNLTGNVSGTPTTFTAVVEISDAGQTKVKGQ